MIGKAYVKYYSPQLSNGKINQKEFTMQTIELANNREVTVQTLMIAHNKDRIITYMLKSVENREVEPSAYIEVSTHLATEDGTTQNESFLYIETNKHDSSFKVKQDKEGNLYVVYTNKNNAPNITKVSHNRVIDFGCKLKQQWTRPLPYVKPSNENNLLTPPDLVLDANDNVLLVYKECPNGYKICKPNVEDISVHIYCISGLGHQLWSVNT